MRFASLRSPSLTVSFREAIFRGLAPDGGLYQPTELPDLHGVMERLPAAATFVDVAAALIGALLPEIEGPTELARNAFPFAPAFGPNLDNIELLELFHGPSCAFKDFGASFLAAVLERFLAEERRRAVVLTATSGDTGGAVARAFLGKHAIDVVVLYPANRVSPLQEKQLTTLGGNVLAVAVQGSFDDCQRMAKEAFVDAELSRQVPLTSANSISLGRLLPQSFYYVWAWAHRRRERLTFCVPSGNFGNLTAGVLAWRWGMPAAGFLATTNRNDVVPLYLRSGEFVPRASIATPSNAMDVGDPSNFERLRALFDGKVASMRTAIAAEVVTDEETLDTIGRLYREHGITVDPHTAVGICGAERLQARLRSRGDDPYILVLATAHPGKFVETIEPVTGVAPELPARLRELLGRTGSSLPIGSDFPALKRLLLERYG